MAKAIENLVDPEGRYLAEGLRVLERQALQLLELMPDAEVARTRDAIQINQGGEEGIVVLVTREALELRLPLVEWTMGSYGPAASSRLWKRVEWAQLREHELAELLAQLQAARSGELRKCPYCGGEFPPERRIEKDVCHACAERHLGVVF